MNELTRGENDLDRRDRLCKRAIKKARRGLLETKTSSTGKLYDVNHDVMDGILALVALGHSETMIVTFINREGVNEKFVLEILRHAVSKQLVAILNSIARIDNVYPRS